ncbi:MAG: porin family protein [Candidatus Cryptobacteroides sp.]
MKQSSIVFTIAAVLLAGICTTANAQFGIHAGYVNSVTNYKTGSSDSDPFSTHGFHLGIEYDIDLLGGLSVQPGIQYSYVAAGDESTEKLGNFKQSDNLDIVEHYLEIPVYLKYTFDFVPEMFGMYLFAGPTFGFGLSSSLIISRSGVENSRISYNFYNGKIKSENVTSDLQKFVDQYDDEKILQPFDILVGGGIGFNLVRHLDLRAGYNYGLIDRMSKNYREDGMSGHRYQIYAGLSLVF